MQVLKRGTRNTKTSFEGQTKESMSISTQVYGISIDISISILGRFKVQDVYVGDLTLLKEHADYTSSFADFESNEKDVLWDYVWGTGTWCE